jgi:hypothetical protein
MAIGKAPAVASISAASAACREALEATVAKFTEVMEDTPAATVRRRLKDATIDLSAITCPIQIESLEKE